MFMLLVHLYCSAGREKKKKNTASGSHHTFSEVLRSGRSLMGTLEEKSAGRARCPCGRIVPSTCGSTSPRETMSE